MNFAGVSGGSVGDLDNLLRLADFLKNIDTVANAAKELRELISKYEGLVSENNALVEALKHDHAALADEVTVHRQLAETNKLRSQELEQREARVTQIAEGAAIENSQQTNALAKRKHELDNRESLLATREHAINKNEADLKSKLAEVAIRKREYEALISRVRAAVG